MRIVLVDDHEIVRQGVATMLRAEEDFDVIGEAKDGRAAVQMVKDLAPDVVVMDIAMPELNGIEATRQIVAGTPPAEVVVLSMHCDKRFVVGVLSAGASGYVQKGCSFDELARAIRAAAQGHTYLSPPVADVLARDYVGRLREENGNSSPVLTPREREIVQLLAEGKAAKQIATVLGISIKTVSTHRRRAMTKLGADGTADLIKYAIREGLTSLDP